MRPTSEEPHSRTRIALVLSGGGARGAYEAGVLCHLFESIYPKLPPGFEFDIVSGSSVGAIHAAYVAATVGDAGPVRSANLAATWAEMTIDGVLRLGLRDLVGVPLRMAGLGTLARGAGRDGQTYGGLVDVAPLEDLVRRRIPWTRLRGNLAAGTPGAVCVAGTEVNTGTVRVFLDGRDADVTPWEYDPYVDAVTVKLDELHVRASAAIPFLFPAVRIGNSFYVDGGLRLNTPLSPAVRLRAGKVLVVGLKHARGDRRKHVVHSEAVVAKPAYMLGKMLDVLLLDPIEYELRQLRIVNALVEGGREAFGAEFDARIDPIIRAKRGLSYRPVEVVLVQPSEDLGRLAAVAYNRKQDSPRSFGLVSSVLTRAATLGVPEDEADLLSYIYFDRRYTGELLELGRADARAKESEILAVLTAAAGEPDAQPTSVAH